MSFKSFTFLFVSGLYVDPSAYILRMSVGVIHSVQTIELHEKR